MILGYPGAQGMSSWCKKYLLPTSVFKGGQAFQIMRAIIKG